ncbi:hypothetical protein Q7P37_009489 [Cladosporium fusiforme]
MSTSPLPTQNQCEICHVETGLMQCKGCLVLYYCGREHQTAHWPDHKKFCKIAQQCNKHVWKALEDVRLGLQASPFSNPQDYFATEPMELGAYLHYRYIYARAVIRLGGHDGVSLALDNCSEITRLDKNNLKNGQTAREFVPGLFLRLGRDQECYDFLKKYCVGNLEEIYAGEGGSLRQPARAENLNHADEFLGNKLPAELFNQIRSYKIGPATKIHPARVKAIEKREDLTPFLSKIEAELLQLRSYVNALDSDYWPAIADPEKYRKLQPMYQPELPITEALSQTYDAWAETPGALELWQELCKGWDAEESITSKPA